MMITHHGINSLPVMGGNTVRIGDRDYPVVQVGTQLWLAENLDLKWPSLLIGIDGETQEAAAWYYANDEATYGANGLRAGLLYNGICLYDIVNYNLLPEGWHVPSVDEWKVLLDHYGGADIAAPPLKSADYESQQWGGTNVSGFNVIPAGYRQNSQFNEFGRASIVWTSSSSGLFNAWYAKYFNRTPAEKVRQYEHYSQRAASIRLVKNL